MRRTRVPRGDDIRPGRSCPLHYRYSASVFRRAPELKADTLYIIGGLYGNVEALKAVLVMKREEERRGARVTLFFNGDFNWFNVDPDDFQLVNETVLEHEAIQGNVEAELCGPWSAAGCGCVYPASVPEEVVERSNHIMERLRATARHFHGMTDRLAVLPTYATVTVGDRRIGIVHGDAESLAGWSFAVENLAPPEEQPISGGEVPARIADYFRQAQVDAFCSTHTCLPVMTTMRIGERNVLIANNGAAGMPNFRATRYGLLTRVSIRSGLPHDSLYGAALGSVRIDALPIHYDHSAWLHRFGRNWGPGSPAHRSYFRRLVEGPEHAIAHAVFGEVQHAGCLQPRSRGAKATGARR